MLAPDKRTRLIQLLGMIGSSHDGEALNAARLAQRLIGGEGMTWEEVFDGVGAKGNGVDPVVAYREGYANGHRDGHAKGYAEGVTAAPVKFTSVTVTWPKFARELLADHELSEWEIGFCESFVARGWPTPTEKQRAVFERMANKFDLEMPD